MDLASKFLAGILVCALCPTVASGAQPAGIKAVKTVDLYTYSEDVTYISTGPHAKHVAFIEDSIIRAYALTSQGGGAVKELFDLTDKTPRGFVNGLAYMESEKRFAIISRDFMEKIMVFEPNGKLQSERTITYPPGYHVGMVEGIEYIPADAAQYPDHLVMCTGEGDGVTAPETGDIMVLTRDGNVVKRIPLPASTWGCGGIAYRAPGELLVTGFNDGDWGVVTVIDFNGNVLAVGPDRIDPAGEGLASLPDGRVVAVGSGGQVLMLGPDLRRMPDGDRTFRETQGLGHQIYGLAWNSQKNGFVLSGNLLMDAAASALYDLPTTFTGAVKLEDLQPRPSPPYFIPRRLTYLPAEGLIAMAQPGQGIPYPTGQTIQLFYGDTGDYAGQIDLTPWAAGRGGIRGVAYHAASNQFAVTFVGETGKVHLASRNGVHINTVDYSGTISSPVMNVEFFPSGNELLMSNGAAIFIGDLNGNITEQYSVAELGIPQPRGGNFDFGYISTGEYAGNFATLSINRAPDRLIIFTFDASRKK